MPRQSSPLSSQRLLLTLLWLIAMLSPATAAIICSQAEARRRDDCTTLEITHLQQFHKITMFGATPKDLMTKIAHSQLEIAKYIAKHPEAIVVREGVSEDHPFGASDGDIMFRDIANMLFPAGLPSDWRELNDLQKEFLWDIEGDRAAMYLGKLEKIYKSVSPELSKKGDTLINAHKDKISLYSAMGRFEEYMEKSGLNKLIMDEREQEAMIYIAAAAQDALNNPERSASRTLEVILIYGGKHNFTKYCEEAGYTHKAIDLTGLALEDYRDAQGFATSTATGTVTPYRYNFDSEFLPQQKTGKERPHAQGFATIAATSTATGTITATPYQHNFDSEFLPQQKTGREGVIRTQADLNQAMHGLSQTAFRQAPRMLMDAEPTPIPS